MRPPRIRSSRSVSHFGGRQLFEITILVLALALGSAGLADDSQRGDDAGPTAIPLQPPGVVTSSLARVLSTVQPHPVGLNGSEIRGPEIRRVAHDLLDFSDMARRALGRHWTALLPQEQDDFVRLFTDVVTQSLVAIVDRYSGENVALLGKEVARGAPERRVVESGTHWAIRDIVFGGMSVASHYRGQFESILRTASVGHLLQRMRTGQSLRPPALGALPGSTAHDLDPPLRERLAAGLLLAAASSARRR